MYLLESQLQSGAAVQQLEVDRQPTARFPLLIDRMQHSVQSPLQLLLAHHWLCLLHSGLCPLLHCLIGPWFGLQEIQLGVR